MGQKQFKKMRRAQKEFIEELNTILPLAAQELDDDGELIAYWLEIAVFIRGLSDNVPISELRPSKLGLSKKLAIFNQDHHSSKAPCLQQEYQDNFYIGKPYLSFFRSLRPESPLRQRYSSSVGEAMTASFLAKPY